jgi:hypothetical protein
MQFVETNLQLQTCFDNSIVAPVLVLSFSKHSHHFSMQCVFWKRDFQ